MSYAVGFAAIAAFVGTAQAVPVLAGAVQPPVDSVVATSSVPVADMAATAESINIPGLINTKVHYDDMDLKIEGDATDLLIASSSLTTLAINHDVSYMDGHIIITIPNKYLNNASKILDLVSSEVVTFGELINTIIGNHNLHKFSPENVQRIVDRVSGPAERVHEIILAATHVVKHLGLKIKTPDDLTQTASDPSCNGICLLLKANKIINEVTTFSDYLAGKVGLEPVLDLIKPVIKATEALVIQLDGDLPTSASSH